MPAIPKLGYTFERLEHGATSLRAARGGSQTPFAALDEQARLIARLKPAHNVDDGRADVDTSFDFGANVKANPGDSQRPATLGEVWSALASAYGGWWRSAGVQVQGGVAYLVGASLTGYEGKKRRAAVDAAQGAATA